MEGSHDAAGGRRPEQHVDLQSIPAAAVRVDSDGCVLEANHRATDLLQCSREELIGRSAPPPPSSRGEALCRVPLADNGQLLLYPDSRQNQDLREQLYHLSRLATVGRLVSTVVHEINNALSGIVGYSQLVLARELDVEGRSDVERIHEEAVRTSKVAQHLLRFSRGGVESTGAIDLAELLQRCGDLKRRDFALKSIQLKLEIAPGLPRVQGNESLLFQVFVNLLGNAEESIHAHQKTGQIVVNARRSRKQIIVQVQDNGPGIPSEDFEAVFQPFYTTRAVGKGTGLGLTICRDILREHGADISLVAGKQKGATFRIRFPVHDASVTTTEPSQDSRSRRPVIGNRHIVIIEDEPVVREVVTRAFNGNGNSVAAFERGEDALEYVDGRSVDLIISDIHRPGLDGIALYDHLQRTRPALARRLLFLTGDTASDSTHAFLRRTGAAHLCKPVLIEDLLETARRLVQAPGDTGAAPGQGRLFDGETTVE